MTSENSLKNLRPCRTSEEASKRGKKGGKIRGRQQTLEKEIKTLWKEMCNKTIKEMSQETQGDNKNKLTALQVAMYALFNLSNSAEDEDVRRKAIIDVLRLSGLEPPQQIQQQTVGVRKVFITKNDVSNVRDAIEKYINDDKNE